MSSIDHGKVNRSMRASRVDSTLGLIPALLIAACILSCRVHREPVPLTAAWRRTLDEPNLARRAPGETYRLYSSEYDGSFVIRIDLHEGSVQLVAKTRKGRDRNGNRNTTTETRRLPRAEWDRLLTLIEEAGFWAAPSDASYDTFIPQGESCTIEGRRGGRYHVVERYAPRTTREFSRLCARFFLLAGMQNPYSPYFMDARRPPPRPPLTPAEQEELDRLNRGAYRP